MAQTSAAVKVAANGRLVLPAAIRKAMGINGETKLTIIVEDGETRLQTIAQNVREAQAMVRKYAKNIGTVDDFIAEKRAEAQREEAYE